MSADNKSRTSVEKEHAPLAPGLYLVSTPIGNLEDITHRALRVLKSVDRIACEDTRQTQKLLNHFAIATPTVSYHLHNEAERTTELVAALQNGERIAIVSDAGTPGISDPGARLTAAAIATGITVFPIPGANAALSALVASGLNAEQFLFHGFLPARSGERRTQLEAVLHSFSNGNPYTHIFYETPHRIIEALADVEAVFGHAHRIVFARELTKLHEEFLRGTVSEVRRVLAQRDSIRGEMVLLIDGTLAAEEKSSSAQTIAAAVSALMQSENVSEKDALKRVAKERGISKSEAYREFQRETKRR
jgi:16S rRNA (cytidine1402-2'-O)-methyltransferase